MKRILSCWQLYVLILPAVIYLFIFNYMPMYGVQIAFRDYRPKAGITGSEWVGLKYFLRFWSYPDFWKIFNNTLTLSLYSIATFPVPVLLALMINELDGKRFKRVVQMVTYAPHFISTVVICSMILMFFARGTGVVNNVLERLGMERVEFLTTPGYFPHIYVWSGVWQSAGWNTIIYLAALAGVSAEMVEAAYIDGASRFQIVRHINLPTILPTVVIMLILNCGSVLSVGFEKVYLMQNSLNLEASNVISTYVYEIGLRGAQFSYSTAIGLFNTVVNVVVLLLVNAVAKRASGISVW